MIVDNIKNARLYFGMGSRIKKALMFLQESQFSGMSPGRYDIDGDNIYALIQKYDSKPMNECKWEAHRRYFDVQYVVEGTEQMGYALTGSLDVIKEYDYEGDYLFFQGRGSIIVCNTGTFVILEPEDAHMPRIMLDTPMSVNKVVVKVKV